MGAIHILAQSHEKNEYKVDPDKHRNEPYDMECIKDGSTIHVEVKGMQGSGEKIILTEREIEHAEKQPMELCVVWGINVKNGKASGGTLTIYSEWNPRDKYRMECIAYRCTLPKQALKQIRPVSQRGWGNRGGNRERNGVNPVGETRKLGTVYHSLTDHCQR